MSSGPAWGAGAAGAGCFWSARRQGRRGEAASIGPLITFSLQREFSRLRLK